MAKKAVTKTVSMKAVRGSLKTAIARLKKLKDPKAQQLAADLAAFQTAKLNCHQTMLFRFTIS